MTMTATTTLHGETASPPAVGQLAAGLQLDLQ